MPHLEPEWHEHAVARHRTGCEVRESSGASWIATLALCAAPSCANPYPMLRRPRVRGGCWSIVDLKGRCLIDVGAKAIDGSERALWIWV